MTTQSRDSLVEKNTIRIPPPHAEGTNSVTPNLTPATQDVIPGGAIDPCMEFNSLIGQHIGPDIDTTTLNPGSALEINAMLGLTTLTSAVNQNLHMLQSLVNRIDTLERAMREDLSQADDWSLDANQMLFMLKYNNEIHRAFQEDDVDFLVSLARTEEYKSIFGTMSFDEAYDRYESTLEGGFADT